jgi:cell division protein FtsI (penicillin-binding protein 3)
MKKSFQFSKQMKICLASIIICYVTIAQGQTRELQEANLSLTQKNLSSRNDDFFISNKKVERGKTSLDPEINLILDRSMYLAQQKYEAKIAFGIISDVNSGELIAASFVDNSYSSKIGKIDRLRQIEKIGRITMEMQGVLKALSFASALNADVPLDRKFKLQTAMKIGPYTIRDHFLYDGAMNICEGFVASSNILATRLVRNIGAIKERRFLKKLGLLDPIRIDGYASDEPSLREDQVGLVSSALGYELPITAFHAVQAISTITNGGNAVKLTLQKSVSVRKTSALISRIASERFRHLLQMNINELYKDRFATSNFMGFAYTQEDVDEDLTTYFVGAFPASKPNHIIFVLLNNPKVAFSEEYNSAGWNALPIGAKIIDDLGARLEKSNRMD